MGMVGFIEKVAVSSIPESSIEPTSALGPVTQPGNDLERFLGLDRMALDSLHVGLVCIDLRSGN